MAKITGTAPPPPGKAPKPAKKNTLFNLLRRYFITGLLVVVPIWGTYLILKALFLTMDGVLGDFMKTQELFYVPGFGIIILLLLIITAGVFTTNIFGKKMLQLWEKLLHQLPLVSNVYSLVKSIVNTLSFQSREMNNFNRVVLIEYPRKECYTIAFVTAEIKGEIHRISSGKVLSVFVPTVPNPISGYILLLPEAELIPLAVTVEEAMKMIFSVGLYMPTLTVDESETSVMMEEGSG
ncbi:MAG: DUF502 domain-containing protein [Nitrospira sp.]|nr:DUF502 domain-containing protein [Candidatus Manganitrophaceae bacterium]HIL34459.1 DUF502 domain-containing protein [Candidatus Manganitrophaceae bacterium]